MARDVLTAQQEHFAQLVVVYGQRQRIAYRKAYDAADMKDATVDVAASQLMRTERVAARIEELRRLCDARLDVTVQAIARELARIGFSDPAELFDEAGNLLPLHDVPVDVRRAIQSVKVVEKAGSMKIMLKPKKGDVPLEHVPERTKEVRLWNKNDALNTMAKWKKMLVEQVEHGAPGEFASMDEAQLAAEEAALDEAIAVIGRARGRKKVTVKAAKQFQG